MTGKEGKVKREKKRDSRTAESFRYEMDETGGEYAGG